MLYSKKHTFPLLAAVFFAACANVVTPQGGNKDTTPPRIDSLGSTPFGRTNFKGKQISINFDEWIVLDNPQQILISPPLKKRADFSIKNKSVVVRWTDTLRENTTYSINFAKAIRDYTENNATENLRMVFSTGSILDTLQVEGNVTDALAGTPAKDVLVQLYDTFQDSIVRKSLPNYFAMTDETGRFKIENVKEGSYKIIALKDINSNYKYDQEGESIAFITDKVAVPNKKPIGLKIFEPEKPLKVQQTKSTQYGRTDLVFTRKPTDVKIRFAQKTEFKTSTRADTLTIWHNLEGKQLLLIEQAKQTKPDTIRFTAAAKTELKTKLRPFIASTTRARKSVSIEQYKTPIATTIEVKSAQILTKDTLSIDFDRPLTSLDADKIILLDTSKKAVALEAVLDPTRLGILHIVAKLQPNLNHTLRLLPNALKDDYGASNDTVMYNSIKRLAQKELGTIVLKLKDLDDAKYYIVEINDANQNIIKIFFIENKKDFTVALKNMQVNNYGFRLITDNNKNRRYDTGNYYEQRQPETILIIAPQALRANWELELTNVTRKGK